MEERIGGGGGEAGKSPRAGGILTEAFWLSWGAVKEISASVFLLASLKLGWVNK